MALPLELKQLLEEHPASQMRRYRLGQTLMLNGQLPDGIALVIKGQLRVLGHDPHGEGLRTLERCGVGALVGWYSLLTSQCVEDVRVSSDEALVLWLPAAEFLATWADTPHLQQWCEQQLPAAELYALLLNLLPSHPEVVLLIDRWPEPLRTARLVCESGVSLDPTLHWFVSSGSAPFGACVPPGETALAMDMTPLRLVGLPLGHSLDLADAEAAGLSSAPESPIDSQLHYSVSTLPEGGRAPGARAEHLQVRRASGQRDAALSLCEAVAAFFATPIDRESILDQVDGFLQRQASLNLVNVGQLLSSLGLRVLLSEIPVDRLSRVPTPSVLLQHGHLALLDGVDADGRARVLEPELGALLIPCHELVERADGVLEVLLLERTPRTHESRFSWGWFLPYLKEHKRALVEVLVASFLVNLLALATPLGLQVLVDQVSRAENLSALISISALLLLASLVTAVLRTLRSLIFTDVANRVDQATKSTILDHLVRLPQSFFDSRPVGQITFYFNQLDRLREFLIGQSLTTVVDFSFSILYVFVLLVISPLLTLVTLSTLPLILVLAFVSNPVVENLINRSMRQAVRTYSYLTESITGIQTIKSQNAELKTRWEFQDRYSRFIGEDFKLRVANETIGNLASFLNSLNRLLVIGFGIWLVMGNKMTLGSFFAFRIISGYVTGPLVKLVRTWQQFKQSSVQIKLVGDVVNRPAEQSELEAANIPMPPLRGDVRFQDVTFRFGEDLPRVLHGVNLDISAGAFVGMVGGSGSGKSTLLKLLPRFYRPETGKVIVDGLDVGKVELYSLRRQIGVVPQDSLLFDGTVKDNLQLVKPDATAEEMIRAARIACAHDFIMEMPLGYNSSVGERGAGLSGGQKQRLALARAVLQNPRMLILDEATSALDARTERQVCLNLFEAFRGRTVFFITHRLSTVRPADTIILMDRGAVMEVGSHQELMMKRGWYYALYQSQNLEGET